MYEATGNTTLRLLTLFTPQNIGTSVNNFTLGAKPKLKGPTKSLSSAVKDVEALVFTNTFLKGLSQVLPPKINTGSSPSLVKLTAISMYCPAL